MAITRRTPGAIGQSAVAVTPALPGGTTLNDFLLLICETNTGEAVTAPAGWTALSSSPQAAADTRLSAFWKLAGASETAPTIADPGDHIAAIIHGFYGVDTASPIVTQAGAVATASTTVAFPSVTPSQGGDCVVHIAAIGLSGNTSAYISGYSAPLLALTDTAAFSNLTFFGGGGGIILISGSANNASAVNNTTATMPNSLAQGKISLVLKAVSDPILHLARIEMGAVVVDPVNNLLGLARIEIGALAADTTGDFISLARVEIGAIVDIAPPHTGRRNACVVVNG